MKKGIHTSNIYWYLTIKCLTTFVLLLVAQTCFYLCNTRIFNPSGITDWAAIIWGNIRFGAATVITVLSPYIFLNLIPSRELRWNKIYHGITETLYVILSLIILIPTIIDTAYYQFTYRRLSSEILEYLTIGGDMGNLIPQFLVDFWPTTICGIVIFAIIALMQCITHLDERNPYASHMANDIAGLILGIGISFVIMRGGFGRQWIQPYDSARYTVAKETALIENSSFNILYTLFSPDLCAPSNNTSKNAEAFDPVFKPLRRTALTNTHTDTIVYDTVTQNDSIAGPLSNEATAQNAKKNIVIIVLESFSQEYMGCYTGDKKNSYTPFIDSLATISTLYDGRSNGKKSIEAIPAIFASIPTLMEKPFIMSKYKDNDIYALPTILAENGYTTAFFHGAYNGTMGFDTFCRKAGFQRYYGMDEYGDNSDYDGTWGIYDEPFLQFMSKKLNTFHKPFFAGVFTISSHHPYSIPPKYTGKFKDGQHPILQCIMYSDNALRQFFKTAAKQPWYKNTLFIITADHPAQGLSREYNDYGSWYRIPMIIFDPSAPTPYRSQRIVQQTDIMPSVLDMLAINQRCITFGTSIFQDTVNGFQIVYGNGFLQLSRPDNITVIKGCRTERYGTPDDKTTDGKDFINDFMRQYYDRMEQNKLKP